MIYNEINSTFSIFLSNFFKGDEKLISGINSVTKRIKFALYLEIFGIWNFIIIPSQARILGGLGFH